MQAHHHREARRETYLSEKQKTQTRRLLKSIKRLVKPTYIMRMIQVDEAKRLLTVNLIVN
jgi:predicted glycosyltransferase involved in capsule biosynthesis